MITSGFKITSRTKKTYRLLQPIKPQNIDNSTAYRNCRYPRQKDLQRFGYTSALKMLLSSWKLVVLKKEGILGSIAIYHYPIEPKLTFT